ncbi:hypothetical protein I2I11_10790 [Pontibacter sp. 172403-2]|uniref:hypothetical protein n=1 Tax=Pontibacter rufus TaxID=2791028 RepID=UPI0018AFC020|nr:hypothetical protein [Pontibacter sp. 172403-2]MBF9253781.1 hypothetical protein [Pontibacter sp. 172403-2]
MKQWYKLYSNIVYLHFSEGFYQLPESAKNAVSPTSPWKRLLKVAGYTIVRLLGNLFASVEHPHKLRSKVWLYVVSQNNYDSLKFIQEGLPDAVFVAGQSKDIGRYNGMVRRLSLRRKILYYYKFLPLYFQFLKHNRQSTLRFSDVLYDAVGFYEVYLRKLQKYKPAAIVFANDHNADARAMLLAAKTLGIKTAYIQHASVSPIFPPLSFDLSLLEGQDTLDKYKLCGPITGKVELVGMPKADAFVPFRNHNSSIQTIGLGCNLMDDLAAIEQLLRELASSFPDLYFILRPHPRDKRDFTFLQNISSRISFSTGVDEPVFEYLKRLDVQISGNSGIHLEAVLLNVWSIYYNFNPQEKLHDYYGFVEQGLVDAAPDAASLVMRLRQHLQHKPDVFLLAKYYNATVGTAFDGKSGELALKLINDFVVLYT